MIAKSAEAEVGWIGSLKLLLRIPVDFTNERVDRNCSGFVRSRLRLFGGFPAPAPLGRDFHGRFADQLSGPN